MKQITIKAKVTHTTEEERIITLPYYGAYKDYCTNHYIAVLDNKELIHVTTDDKWHAVTRMSFGSVDDKIAKCTEITEEEFITRMKDALSKIDEVAPFLIRTEDFYEPEYEPLTESLQPANVLP